MFKATCRRVSPQIHRLFFDIAVSLRLGKLQIFNQHRFGAADQFELFQLGVQFPIFLQEF